MSRFPFGIAFGPKQSDKENLGTFKELLAENSKLERLKDEQTQVIEFLVEDNTKLRDALQLVNDSIYCHDGYRGVGISEEAERAVKAALKEQT